MKKSLIALGVVSMLGIGTLTMEVKASDQGSLTIEEVGESVNGYSSNYKRTMDGICNELTQEEQDLLEQGYNELTQEEKDLFDNYHRQHKRDLSEEEINKYYEITDKVHKYMDEEFKQQVSQRREEKKLYREEMRSNPNRGQGKGRGNRSCH